MQSEKSQNPYWETKTLGEMTQDEWESLCDRCGICCLEKVEDENTGKIKFIGATCEFFETEECRCIVYEDRKLVNPKCIVLCADNVLKIQWLPDTCAYRRVAEGRKLECWHPLLSGDSESVYQAGISVRDKVVSGTYVHRKDIDIDHLCR